MNNFFTLSDEFEKIITNSIKGVRNINQIKTGWTNFVFNAKTEHKSYFFRFPRNNFFSKALVKEHKIIKDVKLRLSLKTPNLKLNFFENRPYTIHKEILGKSLTDDYTNLTEFEKEKLCLDVCFLLHDFYKIKLKKEYQSVSTFLDNLSLVSQNNYDLVMHSPLKNLEKNALVFSHGDFNPGNLILNKNKLVAIIDFSFAGISSPLTDISRIVGRLPKDFSKTFFMIYEKYFKKKMDIKKIGQLCDMWKYVEEKYILYIKKNQPDIILPPKV